MADHKRKLSAQEIAFLEGMTAHHEMALEMARKILELGVDADVRAMAYSILSAQAGEIALMRQWLDEAGVAADNGTGM